MPCVFPILALKALHLSRAGGERATRAVGCARLCRWGDRRHRRARRHPARDPRRRGRRRAGRSSCRTRAPSCSCCCWRSRSPPTCSACSSCRCSAARRGRREASAPARWPRSSQRPAPGRSSAPRSARRCCCRSRVGARLRRARARPALPFLVVAFVPALRTRLPKPGPWMRAAAALPRDPDGGKRCCRAVAALPAGGASRALLGAAALGGAPRCSSVGVGQRQRDGRGMLRRSCLAGCGCRAWVIVAILGASARVAQRAVRRRAMERSARSRATSRQGKPVFVYFTADWCLSCKVNEATSIDRDEVRDAFRKAGVKVLAGDWTNGDPAITRFLESQGRAGVPLYLWYAPGQAARAAAAGAHAGDAHFPRSGAAAALGARSRPSFRQSRSRAPASAQVPAGSTLRRIAVDDDEVGPFARFERADPVLGEARISGAASVGRKRLFSVSRSADTIRPAAGR